MSALCAQIHEMCQFIEWNFILSSSSSSSFHAYAYENRNNSCMVQICARKVNIPKNLLDRRRWWWCVCMCEYEFPYWSIICFLLLKCTYFMAQAYIFTSHVVSFFPQPFSLHTPIDIPTLFEKLSPHTHHYATSKPHTDGISKSNTIFSDYSVVATNDNCDGYENIRVYLLFLHRLDI